MNFIPKTKLIRQDKIDSPKQKDHSSSKNFTKSTFSSQGILLFYINKTKIHLNFHQILISVRYGFYTCVLIIEFKSEIDAFQLFPL